MTLTAREKRRIQIRRAIAAEGHDPDDYEIVFDSNASGGYTLRRLDEDEVAHRRREHLAEAEEVLDKALRNELGYGASDVAAMDVVEMAETFRDQMVARNGDNDGGESR